MSLPWVLAATADGDHHVFLDVLYVLAAAAIVTIGLRRFRLPTIPGYLIAGALIGPGMLGLVSSDASIEQIKGIAVILLMFTIGLHLDLSSIGRGLVHILLVGVVSTVAVVLIGWPIAMAFGLSAPAALAISMAMSMSSTAVVLRLLHQRREMHRMHGRLCVGISIVQDLLSLLMLAMLPILAQWARSIAGESGEVGSGGLGSLLDIISGGAIKLGGIVLLIGFGRFLLPRLLQESARETTGESTLVLSSAVGLGAAVFTASLGFSPELGAFIAGFLLASTPFRYQLAGQLSPMRDLFMALFFTAVGLKVNAPLVMHSWWVLLIALPILAGVKAGVIGLATWGAGATASVSGRTGLALAQAGEFSIVVIGVATMQHVMPPGTDALPIALVVLSLIATPPLYDLGQRLQDRLATLPTVWWLTTSALREGAPESAADRIMGSEHADGHGSHGHHHHSRSIIAGYGVVGRAIADRLEIEGIPFTIVELNPQTVQTQKRLGRRAIYGDIGNPEVLESAGVREADAIFITVPDDDAVLRACQAIRTLAPHVFIAARSAYLSSAFQAHGAGADDVTVAEVATAEAMARRMLSRIERLRRAQGAVTPPT